MAKTMGARTIQVVLRIIFVAMIAGCATTEIPNIERARVYDAGFDQTWNAVVATVAERACPIQAIEKESGVLATSEMALPNPGSRQFREMVVMPSLGLALRRAPRVRMNFVVVREAAARTSVQVNTTISAFDYNWTGQWHQGYSTGKIEADMLGAIGSKLALTDKCIRSRILVRVGETRRAFAGSGR